MVEEIGMGRPPDLGEEEQERLMEAARQKLKEDILKELSKEELIERLIAIENRKIDRRTAAIEAARWVDKVRITAAGGIVLVFLMMSALLYASEGYAFIVSSAAVAFFAWQLGNAVKFRRYLRERYGI